MAKINKRLLELARKTPVKTPGPQTWFDKVPAEDQAALLELRRAFQTGELPHSKRQLYRDVVLPELHIKVKANTFAAWLGERGEPASVDSGEATREYDSVDG